MRRLMPLFLLALSCSSPEPIPAPTSPAPRAPAPAPSPAPRYRVGPPATHRNLSVYPVYSNRPGTAAPLTLDDALARKHARILESSDEGDVNRLTIDNLGSEPILIVGGEIVRGGKQDRIVAQDVVVPPGARGFSLEVFCVEQGRWRVAGSGGAVFHLTSDNLADPEVRRNAALMNAQEGVWAEVARKQDAMEARNLASRDNATLSYAILADNRTLDDAVKGVVEAIEKGLASGAAERPVGFIAAVDGKLMLADVFGSPDLAAKLRAKALRSYALEALSRHVPSPAPAGPAPPAPPSAESALAFLLDGLATRPASGAEAGAARRYRHETPAITAESCVAGDEMIHATIYAK